MQMSPHQGNRVLLSSAPATSGTTRKSMPTIAPPLIKSMNMVLLSVAYCDCAAPDAAMPSTARAHMKKPERSKVAASNNLCQHKQHSLKHYLCSGDQPALDFMISPNSTPCRYERLSPRI